MESVCIFAFLLNGGKKWLNGVNITKKFQKIKKNFAKVVDSGQKIVYDRCINKRKPFISCSGEFIDINLMRKTE